MFNSLIAKTEVAQTFFMVSAAESRLAYLNIPNRLQKFKKNYGTYVKRYKQNKVQIPFNSHLPYVLDGDKNSKDFYGNPHLLDYKKYEFPDKRKIQDKPNPNFPVSKKNPGPISYDRILIDDITNTLSREEIEYLMRRDYYVKLLFPDKKRNNEVVEKKYWFPTSGAVLDAVITAEKLYGFVCFDPLNPYSALRPIDLSQTLPKNTKARKSLFDERYKRFARAKTMFTLFGVSTYNVNNLREFLLNQIGDFNNCCELGHNEYGYTASYIIPVAFFSKNEENFTENNIFQFYVRPNEEVKRDIDSDYVKYQELLSSEPLPTCNSLEVPEKNPNNNNFLENLSFSLKKAEDEIKEYYLVVVFMAEPELHTDTPNCTEEGWSYRPNVHGRLITIIAKEKKNLTADQKIWLEKRKSKKGV